MKTIKDPPRKHLQFRTDRAMSNQRQRGAWRRKQAVFTQKCSVKPVFPSHEAHKFLLNRHLARTARHHHAKFGLTASNTKQLTELYRLNNPNCFNLSHYRASWMGSIVNTQVVYSTLLQKILKTRRQHLSRWSLRFQRWSCSFNRTDKGKDGLVFPDEKVSKCFVSIC